MQVRHIRPKFGGYYGDPAYGSLTTGLDLRAGQTLLIRGGTSALGFATTTPAREIGATVLATTRGESRLEALRARGVDHPLVDDGKIADRVRELFPDGVDAAVELVGTPTLPDTLAATRVHGTGRCASPGCCPTSGPCRTSTPSGTCPRACG